MGWHCRKVSGSEVSSRGHSFFPPDFPNEFRSFLASFFGVFAIVSSSSNTQLHSSTLSSNEGTASWLWVEITFKNKTLTIIYIFYEAKKKNTNKMVTPSKQTSVTDLSTTTISVSNTSEPRCIIQNSAILREPDKFKEQRFDKNPQRATNKNEGRAWEDKAGLLTSSVVEVIRVPPHERKTQPCDRRGQKLILDTSVF